MKHISILVPEGALLGSVEGPRQVFSEINDFIIAKGEQPLFSVDLVGQSKQIQLNNGLVTIHPTKLLNEVKKTDLVIIPALGGDLPKALEQNKSFIPWIIEMHKGGSEVASLCIGAFLLASTGLVNGKKVATHWMAAAAFRQMFPEVELVEEKILTDEHGLYSSGGAFSYLNLIIYLVEKYAGRELAVYFSKVFAIEINRGSQSPFMIFMGQKEHEDEPVTKAQEFIEQHFDDRITVDQLANMFALSRRNLERRFKKATANSINEYLQRVRIEAAKKRLESPRMNVQEVMYDVGYTDVKAFRNTFKKITGLSPLEYRNKYGSRMVVA
jgi:transcriptional regulator GlxA family with amidase domain